MFRKPCMLCQRTSLKRWFGNRTMTSNCDVTNSAHQIQMTTLCHWMNRPPWKFSACATDQKRAPTRSGLDILQDTCDFLDQDWIWIFIFEKYWIMTWSGYLFDFYNENFLRVIQDVTNDGAVVFLLWFLYSQKIKTVLSVNAALITIDENLCYFIVNIFSS